MLAMVMVLIALSCDAYSSALHRLRDGQTSLPVPQQSGRDDTFRHIGVVWAHVRGACPPDVTVRTIAVALRKP